MPDPMSAPSLPESDSERVQEKLNRLSPRIPDIMRELQAGATGERQRQAAIESIEKKRKSRLVCYTAFVEAPGSEIGPGDIVPLAQVLDGIGQTERLDLMLHSPGGDANTAEKIIDMCRKHCTESFRVIVPNMAKSAGTLVVLGADQVTMGYLSELGPIDAQVLMPVGGIMQQLSAQSFIEARDELEDKVAQAIKEGEPPDAYLQQLALLNPAFVKHCERLMGLAMDMAKKWMAKYMLRGQPQATRKAGLTAKALSSTSRYFTHGRYISGEELKNATGIHLEIELLSQDDPLWEMITELYVRTEIYMRSTPPLVKLIESSTLSIPFSSQA